METIPQHRVYINRRKDQRKERKNFIKELFQDADEAYKKEEIEKWKKEMGYE